MRKFTLLLFFVVFWAFSYALMGGEQYFVDIHVSHNYEMIKALSQFLKENGYEYEVYKKGRVK